MHGANTIKLNSYLGIFLD